MSNRAVANPTCEQPSCKQATGGRLVRVLPQGVYEVEFTLTIPGFDSRKLYYEWAGQMTGPWDYSWLPENEGALLLPLADLYIDGRQSGRTRVFIPQRDCLERGLFRGILGFRQDHDGEVTLELRASDATARCETMEVRRVWDLAATYRREAFHLDGQKFWLTDGIAGRVRQQWSTSRWGQHLDRALEGFKDLEPPRSQGELKAMGPALKKVVTNIDTVVFPGHYLSALALRFVAQGRESDWEQMMRWFDAIIDLQVWGLDADPDGRDHNNDLAAAHEMFGVAVVLSWFGERLGEKRLTAARKKVRYQVGEMVKWIVSARSSWPGVFTQNHTYYGYQTVLLGSLLLMDQDEEALEWVNIAAMGFKKFAQELPSDGTFQEGQGYECFGLLGLLPGLLLLEQVTHAQWMPREWVRKHLGACTDLMPPGVVPGLAIGDGDNVPPAFLPLVAWQLHDAGGGTAGADTARRLVRRLNRYKYDFFGLDFMPSSFWFALWGDTQCDAPESLGNEEPATGVAVHTDSGHVIIDLTPEAKLYFLAGPPSGHRLLRREHHPYTYGHHHPDAGDVLLNVAGNWVLADTGYTYAKRSSEHNVLTVRGQGQHNDGYVWTAEPPAEMNPPEVQVFQEADCACARLDLACYYPSRLGLSSWIRRVYGVYGKGVVVIDDVLCEQPSDLTLRWGSERPWEKLGATYQTSCGTENVRFCSWGSIGNVAVRQIVPCKPKSSAARVWHALELSPPAPVVRWVCVSAFVLPGSDVEPVYTGEEMNWGHWRAGIGSIV